MKSTLAGKKTFVVVEGKTQCYIESGAMTSQTSLTCYFPEDLSKTKADPAVYHYTRNGNSGIAIEPLKRILSFC